MSPHRRSFRTLKCWRSWRGDRFDFATVAIPGINYTRALGQRQRCKSKNGAHEDAFDPVFHDIIAIKLLRWCFLTSSHVSHELRTPFRHPRYVACSNSPEMPPNAPFLGASSAIPNGQPTD